MYGFTINNAGGFTFHKAKFRRIQCTQTINRVSKGINNPTKLFFAKVRP
jgi:hypothetical protein